MMQVLGGSLAIRHGVRTHWSADNTALHCVRAHCSHYIVIEEVDLVSVLANVQQWFKSCNVSEQDLSRVTQVYVGPLWPSNISGSKLGKSSLGSFW